MPIPDFQTLMRPLLEHFADGENHPNRETLEAMARHFSVSDDERAKLLPSGKQPVFVNRIAWSKSHLKGAGAIRSHSRGVYAITDRGRNLRQQTSGPIRMADLKQFEDYRNFRRGKSGGNNDSDDDSRTDDLTPEEHIEYGYQQVRSQLASEILDQIHQCPPEFFEKLVVELLVAMGYGGSRADAGRAVGKSGDGGIDGIIKEDRLGLDAIYIQAKRWEGVVGRPEIQKFAGALQGFRARKGIFITSSSFTKDAELYAGGIESKIVLIDGERLADLMIDFGVGVTSVQTYELKRLDSDYFSLEE